MTGMQVETVNIVEKKKVWRPSGLVRLLANFFLMGVARFANAMTIDVNGVQVLEKTKTIICKVVLSGNYVQAVAGSNVGEVLIPNGAANPAFLPGAAWGLTGPSRAYVINGPAGFAAEMIPGADNFHWLLKIFSAAGVEHVAGAYEAALTGDVNFKVAFEGRPID